MRYPAWHAVVIALVTLVLWSGEARSNEIVNSTRESIIQSVRDDVRRRIQERRAYPPQHEHHWEHRAPR
jgi:hypothetical protein